MATLHVRNVPDKLYRRIQKLAQQENRSLTAEVVDLLTRGIEVRETRQGAAALLQRIQHQARKAVLPAGWKDSTELLREDRSR